MLVSLCRWPRKSICPPLIPKNKYPFFFLAGRRGIFDGVIEEIHQHWKHKEIVKVITKQNQAYQITCTSMLLEVETGGMLIATQKLTNSHAIILYRGKNYRRPTKSSPSNLLSKREALRRSVEVQRRGVGILQKSFCIFPLQISVLPNAALYLTSLHLICSQWNTTFGRDKSLLRICNGDWLVDNGIS